LFGKSRHPPVDKLENPKLHGQVGILPKKKQWHFRTLKQKRPKKSPNQTTNNESSAVIILGTQKKIEDDLRISDVFF
jgi:hypothetical protein